MNVNFSRFLGNRKILGAAFALISLLIMGFLGNWPLGVGLALLFLAVSFLSQPVLLRLMWIGGCVLLTCCYPSWMVDRRFFDLGPDRILLNILCAIIVYSFFLLVFGRIRSAVSAASGVLLLLCIVNYYVYQFRGSELRWADFLSVRTALNVASGYSFQISPVIVQCVLCWSWTLFAAGALPKEVTPLRPRITRVYGAAVAILSVSLFCWNSTYLTSDLWDRDGSLYTGYILNFSLGMRDSMVQKPQDYRQLITDLEESYPQQEVSLPEELPNIVVIMDEALADMRVLGNLKTNQPVTPFLDALTDNTIRGYALSSVFGGTTPNSEFEFLTGSSMSFLPSGSVAYMQYLRQTAFSLPWLLQSYGYETFATHPYLESGWNRPAVYDLIGFQDTSFLGAYPEEDLVRQYVSDREMVRYILNRLEQQGDAPLFLFGVSMQNHSGYTDAGYKGAISLQDQSLPQVEQYLSLIHETDEAIELLLTSLENSPRKTIVLVFGDHFPGLDEEFYLSLHGNFDTLSDQMLQYQVPFYLWANYDIPEQSGALTSLNYLALDLLETAGLPLSSYYQFLSDAREVIPAINAFCFRNPDGQVLTREQADSTQTQWLALYEAAQYNNLFGKKERSRVLYP